MQRRTFFKKAAGAARQVSSTLPHNGTFSSSIFSKNAARPAATGLAPHTTDTLTQAELVHLLKRTMFGANRGDLAFFATKTLPEIVDDYLLVSSATDPSGIPPALPASGNNYYWHHQHQFQADLRAAYVAGQDPYGLLAFEPPAPVNNYETDEYRNGENYKTYDWSVPEGKPFVLSRADPGNCIELPTHPAGAENQISYYRQLSMMGWWMKLMHGQGRSIREKMTLFWANFFPTNQAKAGLRQTQFWWYNAMLRHHCTGNFRELLTAVTKHPMMLVFLDGYVNNVSTPNQNYGRELQEIYALGLPPAASNNGQSYTEQDVIEVSRILTGWTTDAAPGAYLKTLFDANGHDNGSKQLSSFYDDTVIAGAGESELETLLDLMFEKDAVSLNVVRKLYRFFVNTHISTSAETEVIEPLAEMLRDENYELLPVLSTLLQSQHFFDIANRGAHVKPPMDFVIGLLREIPWTFTQPNIPRCNFELNYHFYNQIRNIGQTIEFPDAFGWRAYYDLPAFDKSWLNGSLFTERKDLFERLVNNNFKRSTLIFSGYDVEWEVQFDLPNFILTGGFTTPQNAQSLLDQIAGTMLVVTLCEEANDYLLEQLETTALDWTATWQAYAANPADPALKAPVTDRLFDFFIALNSMEEYHLI